MKNFKNLKKWSSQAEHVLNISDREFRIYFKSTLEKIDFSQESQLAASILPAMKCKTPIRNYSGNLSFLKNVSTIQDIYSSWSNDLTKIPIAEGKKNDRSKKAFSNNRVGVFFSGGVDSFYSAVKNAGNITDLIFVHGFDINLNNILLRDKVSERLSAVAESLEVNLIEVETNLRDMLDMFVKWGPLGHGAALATIGHLFPNYFRRILIPATYTYSSLFPWGSHPVLDHLWSTPTLEFIHDGCEATRVQKISFFSGNKTAQENLRVCWRNINDSYNCGKCEKCIRTMINLLANDCLDKFKVFDSILTPAKVLSIRAQKESVRSFVLENLDKLDSTGKHEDYQIALRRVLKGTNWIYRLKRCIRKGIGKLIR